MFQQSIGASCQINYRPRQRTNSHPRHPTIALSAYVRCAQVGGAYVVASDELIERIWRHELPGRTSTCCTLIS
ncbi:MAG: hypothetical protein JWR34_4763 [Mycobacterium sp.]|nr:hypothetical protein [Mycobacterium sp.]